MMLRGADELQDKGRRGRQQGARSKMHKPKARMIFEFMEPNPYDTVETWERFLARLRQEPDQDNPYVASVIAHAEDLIERKRRAS